MIPVEVWGERLCPLVVGTFWLGRTPQHYKKNIARLKRIPYKKIQKTN
jgi:hypothetical protein